MVVQTKSMHLLSKQDLEVILSNESNVVFSADNKTIYLRLYNSRSRNNYQCIKLADFIPNGETGDKLCSCYQDAEKVTRCASRAAELCIVRSALQEFLEKRKSNSMSQHEPLTEYPDIIGMTQ